MERKGEDDVGFGADTSQQWRVFAMENEDVNLLFSVCTCIDVVVVMDSIKELPHEWSGRMQCDEGPQP